MQLYTSWHYNAKACCRKEFPTLLGVALSACVHRGKLRQGIGVVQCLVQKFGICALMLHRVWLQLVN